MIDTIVQGGLIVTPSIVFRGDVLINAEKIVGISTTRAIPEASKIIDATGDYVLPGVIDVHVHPYTDGWGGTLRSAAYGGVTSVLFMMKHAAEETVPTVLEQTILSVSQEAVIDFGFHVVLREPVSSDDILDSLSLGATSFKIFMAHMNREECLSDAAVFSAMREIGANGGLCLVHAEHGELVRYLESGLSHQGRTGIADYSATHPPSLEAEAVSRAIDLAALANCPLYLVHITTAAALMRIRRSRELGQEVVAETCLPFLLLTDDDLIAQGPRAKIAPALRSRQDVEELWQGLRENAIRVVSSDHAAHPIRAKMASASIFEVPSGLPGTEFLLPLLFSEGVVNRGMSLTWLAQVLADWPARIFGLHPRKGSIQVGADADLVIFDPQARWTISEEEQHSLAEHTPYVGWTVQGRPRMSLVRGKVVLDDSMINVSPGYGKYLRRPVAAN